MITRVCPTCSAEFDTDSMRKKYCTPACRPKNDRRSNRAKHKARKAKADEHEVEFIAIDGEGVTTEIIEEVLVMEKDYFEYVDDEGNWIVGEADVPQWIPQVMDTEHNYVLLSVGEESLHKNGKKLTHDEVFTFLYDQFKLHPKATFVGFFLGYDFSQWLQTLSEWAGYKLFHKKGIAERMPSADSARRMSFPVYVANIGKKAKWEIDSIGMRRFKLRPHVPKSDWPECQVAHKTPVQIEECETGAHRKHPYEYMYICDAGPFWQTSLENVIAKEKWEQPIATDEEYAIIARGKARRKTARFDEEMIEYNVTENRIFARAMGRLNEGFVSAGIRLKRTNWYGPGQAAQAWLHLIHAPKGEVVREVTPPWALEAAQYSYYGGWFEVFVHGPIPGKTYNYDIVSAYPHAISELPCLLHGRWSKGQGKPGKLPQGSLRLLRGRFQSHHWNPKNHDSRDVYIGSMPHRAPNGSILRPNDTIGWHWEHEIEAARRAKMVWRSTIYEWVQYDPCDCPPPMAAIQDMFDKRFKVGKKSPHGMAIKLVINSTYGKFAQSIGMPVFSNPIYASLITAHCRTKVIDAIATHPIGAKDVVMVATDGVVFLSPHPGLNLDDTKLGQWEETVYENLSCLMPGLYWSETTREAIRNGKKPSLKTRGTPAKAFVPVIDKLDEQWVALRQNLDEESRWGDPDEAPVLKVHVDFGFTSPKLATTRGAWETCGQVHTNIEREINADPSSKRGAFYLAEGLLRTEPRSAPIPLVKGEDRMITLLRAGTPETLYYDKTFGVSENEYLENTIAELQEYLTPEGTGLDAFKELQE